MLNEEDERETGKSGVLFEEYRRSFQVEVTFPYRVEQGGSVQRKSRGESGAKARAETEERVSDV